jgi:hypothetical protein
LEVSLVLSIGLDKPIVDDIVEEREEGFISGKW